MARGNKIVGMNIPTILIMALLAIVTFFALFTNASHFMSGSYDWEITDAGASAKLSCIQSYRWSAFFGVSTALTGKQTISPSSIYMGTATTTGTASVTKSQTLTLSVTAKNVDTLAVGDFWLYGNVVYDLTTNQYWKTVFSMNANLFAYFNMCCRIGGLQDGNSDQTASHSGWWSPVYSKMSVYGRNFPREWVEYGININTMWQLGAVNRDSNAPLYYTISPTSGGLPGASSLRSAQPDAYVSGKALTIPNTLNPVFNWVPSVKPATGGYKGYAVSFTVEDKSFTGKAKLAVQLDFLFMSGNPCLPTDKTCNHAPTLKDNQLSHEVLATIPYYYTFIATDIDSAQKLTIEHDSPLPVGMTIVLRHGTSTYVENSVAKASLALTFDTEIDGSRSSLLCMKVVDSSGSTSTGSFCSTYNIVRPPYMFISGTARKFTTSTTTNRIDGLTYPWGNAVLSNTVSGSLRRPTITTASTGITSAAFDSWWSDSTASAVTLYSMTMVQHSTLNTGYDKYDTAKPQRVYTLKNPQWSKKIGQNEYWSYEVHTKMDILDTETLSFSVSGGELFVFINSVLVVSITDKMSRVNTDQIELNAAATNLTFTDIRNKIGKRTAAATDKADSYNVDIFYTHRNTANPGSFYLSFANSTACSAITLLRSPQYSALLESAQVFNYIPGTWDKAFAPGNGQYSQWYTSLSTATATSAGLQLISTTDSSTSSTAWFNATNVKVLSGFEFTFSFKMTGNANGLVFAIQNHSPQFKGSDGAGLGYSGGTNVVALEFDTFADSGVDSPYNYQHISVHTSSLNNPIVSSIESASTWPSGSQPVGNLGTISPDLDFRFTNGTEHNIRVELSPSEVSYFMYVYVNDNIKPLYTASLDKDFMKTAFADGAFIGFTTSNTASRQGSVLITKAKLIVIPPLASASKVTSTGLLRASAGERLTATIQLNDACGSPLLVAGEGPKMFGKMIHKYSFVPEVFDDDNAVFDTVTTEIEDMGEGRYRFSGVPRRAGDYKLYIYYREQDQTAGQGQPIGKGSLTNQNDKFVTAHFYEATVTAGSMSPATSFYTYSDILPSLTNTKNPTFFDNATTNNGVACVAVSSTGRFVSTNKGKIFTVVADYTEWVAKQQLAVCVNRDNAVTIVNTARAAAGTSGTAPTTQYSATWAIVNGKTTNFNSNQQTAQFSKTTIGLLSFYLLSACPNHAAGTYGEGMILLQPTAMEVDTMESGEYYIALRDRFNNWILTGPDEDLVQSYTPSLPRIGKPIIMDDSEPFLLADFTAGSQSGEYKLSLTTQSQVPIGETGTLIVNAGAAWYNSSSASGLTVGGPVDTLLGFNILLRDKGDNVVLSQSDDLMEIYRIDFVDTTNPQHIPLSIDQRTLYTKFWNPTTKQYEVKYTPTFAGVYYVKIYINPPTAAQTNPTLLAQYEMTQSKGQVVAILAGPAHRFSSVQEYLPDATTFTKKTLTLANVAQTVPFPLGDAYSAGTSSQYNIQSRDVYGNTRITSVAAGLEYRMELFALTTNGQLPTNPTTAASLSVADFAANIDTTLSNLYPANQNYLTAVHAGSGQYITRVVWKKAQNTGIGVRFVLYDTTKDTREIISAYTYAANGFKGDTQEPQETAVQFAARQGAAAYIAKVNAGQITSNSLMELLCGNVVCTSTSPIVSAGVTPSVNFRFTAKDRYGNVLTNQQLTEAQLRSALSIAYETSTSTYYASTTYTYIGYDVTGKYFTGSLVTTIAGEYKIIATVNTDSTEAQTPTGGASKKFFITPAVSDIPKIKPGVLFPSALSTKSFVNIEFVDRDGYDNQRLPTVGTTAVAETTFQVYLQRQGATQCVDFSKFVNGTAACAPTQQGQGRPSYQCGIQATDQFENQLTTILLTTSTCPKDTTTGCPQTTCSASQTVRVEESGETSAFVVAVEEVDTKVVKTIAANQWTLGNFIAGVSLKIYVTEPTEPTSRVPAGWVSNFVRTLTLVGQGAGHQFNSVAATAKECTATLSSTVCTTTNNMLGKRVYVFDLLYTKKLPADKLNFAIAYIDKSTQHNGDKYYSFAINPTKIDPNRSILDRTESTVNVVAGTSWSYRWAPVDKFGNSITTIADFIGLTTTTKTVPYNAIYRSTNSFITKDGIVCTFADYASIASNVPTFIETRVTTDPVGVVTCTVPGTSFTTAGVTAVYVATSIDTTFTAGTNGKLTDYINQQMIMLNIKPAPVHLPNTIISLFPTDSMGFQATNYQTAGTTFTVYAFPRDEYKNPTALTTDVTGLAFKLTQGLDIFTTNPTLTTVTPWAESTTYTTPTKVVFETSIKITQPSRDGFALSLTSTNRGSTVVNNIKLYSAQPNLQAGPSVDVASTAAAYKTALYLPTSTTTPLKTTDLALTVDSAFAYTLKVFDVNGQPFLRNLASSVSTDTSNIMVSFTFLANGNPENQKTLPISVTAMYNTQKSTTQAVYGEFAVSTPTTSLSTIGNYQLTIETLLADQTKRQIASYTFTVAAGAPYIDYTTVEMQTFATGVAGEIKFKLYDKLNNLITTPWVDTGDDIIVGYKPKLNRVIPSIHIGQTQCTDVHQPEIYTDAQGNVSEYSTTYKLPFVHESNTPAWDMGIKFDATTGTYTATIVPLSGMYTFNLTLISPNQLNLPASAASCERLLPFSFKVLTGTAMGATSTYTITPVNAKAQVPGGRNDVGYAGYQYNVELTLRDREGTPVEKTTKAYIFYSPQQDIQQLPTTNGTYLYYDPNTTIPGTMVMTTTRKDRTNDYGYGLWEFTFIPTKASNEKSNGEKEPYQFAIFIYEETSSKYVRVTGPGYIEKFTVLHGTPEQVIVSPIQSPIIAGENISFTVSATDKFNNAVTTPDLHSLQLSIERRNTTFIPHTSPLVEVGALSWVIVDNKMDTQGLTTAKTVISWEGLYAVTVTLRSKDGMSLLSLPVTIDNIIVIHQTCAGQYLAQNPNAKYNEIPQLRCLSNKFECVKSYTECETPADRIVCEYGQILDETTGKCQSLTTVDPTYKECPTTKKYVKDLTLECPPATTCPSGTVQCQNTPTECRAAQKDCPSTPACPAGMVMCANGVTCATTLNACPTIPQTIYNQCQAQSKIICPTTGLCVDDIFDCASPVTCPYAEQVLCLTDNSCQFNIAACPTPPANDIANISPQTCQTKLNNNNAVLCMDGLTCALSFEQCPQQVTCPVGYVKCATDGSCKQRTKDCTVTEQDKFNYEVYLAEKQGLPLPKDYVPLIKPNITTTKCALTEYQCPLSGQCVQNSNLCATSVTCPSTAPVLCSDYSCAKTLALCQKPLSCESIGFGYITCPGTGQCAASAEFCTPTVNCDNDKGEFLCATTRQCVTKQSDCPQQSACAPSIPYMCSNGECRASLADCPSSYTCPTNKPIICPQTGSCATSTEVCFANSQTNTGSSSSGSGSGSGTTQPVDPTQPEQYDPLKNLGLNDCPTNFVRCASGACAKSLLTCPTITSCPTGLKRCGDGTCRVNCEGISPEDCNSQGLVQCPVATQGSLCARRLSECPQSPTCPLTAPVKCIDNSCAINLESCPEFIVATSNSGTGFVYPTDRIPCPDGSWSYSTCPTPVTCLPEIPIKCNDGVSCKTTVNQCATLSPCGSEDKPYRCSTGVCAASILDCAPSNDSICDRLTTPIKCPIFNGEFKCVSQLKDCPQYLASANNTTSTTPSDKNIFEVDLNDKTIVPKDEKGNPVTTRVQDLTTIWEYTECQAGYTYCRVSGLCVQGASSCPDMTCPLSFPYLCPDGGCARNVKECTNILNGCPFDAPVRCPGDGSCVDRLYNCPTSKCTDGQKACPDGSCTSDNCKFAANGCLTGESRCSDGTCVRDITDCTAKTNSKTNFYPNSCPPAMPYKCSNGLCVEQSAQCPRADSSYTYEHEFTGEVYDPVTQQNVTTKWKETKPICWENPNKPVLCANGQCMSSTELCPIVKPCTIDQPFRCDDGSCREDDKFCPKTSICKPGYERCKQQNYPNVAILDGVCAPIGQCLAVNGCPVMPDGSAAYFRCGNGKCVADKTTCDIGTTEANGCPSITPTKCWNGECIAQSATCPPTNGCPVNQPFRCQSGICLENAAACTTAGEDQKMCDKKYTCPNGDCVDNLMECKTTFGCPIEKPVRCGDGTCKKYTADYRNPKFGLTKQQIILDTCPPITLCATDAYKMCSNSRCVLDLQECDADLSNVLTTTSNTGGSGSSGGGNTPITATCESQGLVTCFDINKTCRPTFDKCFSSPKEIEITLADGATIKKETIWVEDTTLVNNTPITKCPISSAVQCANGACVTDYVMCPTLNLPKSSTITGSPSASQQSTIQRPNGDEVKQVLCTDGAYRDTYEECIQISKNIIEQQNLIVIEKYQQKVKQLQDAGWSLVDIEKYYPDPVKYTTPVEPEDGSGSGDGSDWPFPTPVPTPPKHPYYNDNYEFALKLPTSYCSDGTPIYNNASQRVVCPIIPACPTGHWRCLDGTCSTSQCDGITMETLSNDKVNCTAMFGKQLCVDGSCNALTEPCPQYNGCAIGYYQCANRECVIDPKQCTAAANRNADDFAQTLLHQSIAYKYGKDWMAFNNKVQDKTTIMSIEQQIELNKLIFVNLNQQQEEEQQQVEHIDDISISLTDDINNLPYNSMIQQFQHDLQKYKPNNRKQQQQEEEYDILALGNDDDLLITIDNNNFITTALSSSDTGLKANTVDGKNKYYKACSPDLSTCMSTQQIAKTSILYDATQSEATYTIGPLSTAFTVKLSSGLAIDQTKDTSIYFNPVAESVYYNATNRVTYSRIGEFGEALTAVQTVLSPVMTCTAGNGIIEPFSVPIEVSSLVDRTVMTPTIAPQDICLARLRRYPDFNYAVWECIYSDEQRKSGALQYTVRQSDTQPLKQAISTITTCQDLDQPQEAAIYAFIHQPVSTKQVYKMSLDTFLKDNIIWIMFVIIGAVFVLFAMIYAIMRLSRYANKTKDVKKEIERTEEELNQMEQGNHVKRDDELLLQVNPLSVAIQQQNQLVEETDPELIEKKKREQEEAQMDATERQEYINTLDEANKADLERLEQLRAKAQQTNAARRI